MYMGSATRALAIDLLPAARQIWGWRTGDFSTCYQSRQPAGSRPSPEHCRRRMIREHPAREARS